MKKKIDDAVTSCKCGVDEQGLTSGTLCDKIVSSRFRKSKFYKVIVRPIMLYEIECQLVNNLLVQKKGDELNVCTGTLERDFIMNKNIREKIESNISYVKKKLGCNDPCT